ncbi:MAG: RecX family transcriptional regulator [Lachnospiraceae bacterium]|nr:RecX family transcriptional regulator [Lachnospiraceae bacterium]
MLIKNISEFNSTKYIITLDNGIAFVLYKGDLSKFGIKEGDADEDIIDEIFNEILPKRAMDRSLKIITGKDVTEGELFKKLENDLYPRDIIEDVIDRLKKERLIDDERYVRNFIEAKSEKKSKRDILSALYQKEINADLANRIYDELKDDGSLFDEKELIIKLLNKRHFDFENASFEEKQKQINYLLQKGFSYDSIHSALKNERYRI